MFGLYYTIDESMTLLFNQPNRDFDNKGYLWELMENELVIHDGKVYLASQAVDTAHTEYWRCALKGMIDDAELLVSSHTFKPTLLYVVNKVSTHPSRYLFF